MYEYVLEDFEELLLRREVLGVSGDDNHPINDEIQDYLSYLDRHL